MALTGEQIPGETPPQLQNAFATSVSDIRPQLREPYRDTTEYWLNNSKMSRDQLAVRVHHRVVKIHPDYSPLLSLCRAAS